MSVLTTHFFLLLIGHKIAAAEKTLAVFNQVIVMTQTQTCLQEKVSHHMKVSNQQMSLRA